MTTKMEEILTPKLVVDLKKSKESKAETNFGCQRFPPRNFDTQIGRPNWAPIWKLKESKAQNNFGCQRFVKRFGFLGVKDFHLFQSFSLSTSESSLKNFIFSPKLRAR